MPEVLLELEENEHAAWTEWSGRGRYDLTSGNYFTIETSPGGKDICYMQVPTARPDMKIEAQLDIKICEVPE